MTHPAIFPAFAAVAIDHAARVLFDGKLIVTPTDTVYGLSAAYSRPDAIARIYAVKRRPIDRPIPLLVDRIEDVEKVAAAIPPDAIRLMERFWPGGLTLALPRAPGVPDVVTAGGPTVAVRMPNHPVPRALIRRLAEPLPATSANRSGEPSPVTVEQAFAELGDDVAMFLDAGPAPGGVDSTVVDMTTGPPTVLRVGAVGVEALESALGYAIVVANGRFQR